MGADDLEDSLAECWDWDTLAIYADQLQLDGDPRGELIALDLQAARGRVPCEAPKRRDELLRELVGTAFLTAFPETTYPYGFVELVLRESATARRAAARELFDGPLGRYVRQVQIAGSECHLQWCIANVAGRANRWLRSIEIWFDDCDEWTMAPVIDARTTARLIAATPRLELVDIYRSATLAEKSARPVFAAFDHPHVRKLRLS